MSHQVVIASCSCPPFGCVSPVYGRRYCKWKKAHASQAGFATISRTRELSIPHPASHSPAKLRRGWIILRHFFHTVFEHAWVGWIAEPNTYGCALVERRHRFVIYPNATRIRPSIKWILAAIDTVLAKQ